MSDALTADAKISALEGLQNQAKVAEGAHLFVDVVELTSTSV